MAGFPNQVNLTQAPAMEGDFASSNPRFSVDAGPGAFVAASGGVTVGRFAWMDGSQLTVASTGSGVPTGFVHREQQGLQTTYLAETSYVIPQGFMVTLMKSGDFWVKHTGGSAVTVGMKAYAVLASGAITFAAAGATIGGAIETKWYAESAGLAGELIKMSALALG